MKHDAYKEWILLLVVGELGDGERRELDAHLSVCASCRDALEETKAYVARMGEAAETGLSDETLQNARHDLRRTLGKAHGGAELRGERRGATRGWLDWLHPARVALAGTAAVAIGFLAAYIVFGRMEGAMNGVAEAPPADTGLASGAGGSSEVNGGVREIGAPSYGNVRLASIDPRSNQVEIEYDMIRPARIKADIGDERVRKILAQGVTDDSNPAARLQAIHTIGAYMEKTQGEEIKHALIRAVKTDPNAGVRKQALYVLYQMPFDDDIKNACLHVLAGDENEGLRIAAINMLGVAMLDGHIRGEDVFDAVGARLRNDENGYIRVQSGAFQQEVNGHEN